MNPWALHMCILPLGGMNKSVKIHIAEVMESQHEMPRRSRCCVLEKLTLLLVMEEIIIREQRREILQDNFWRMERARL